jgi:hypothetical protein
VAETLEDFARRSDLLRLGKAEQVRHLAWFLHSLAGKDRVVTGDLRDCYQQLHLEPPNISQYLGYLSEGKGRSFIRDKRGFRLEGTWRARLNDSLAEHSSVIAVRTLLSDLVPRLGDSAERAFLEEALRCYSVQAFRATVVMAWNLAFSHLRSTIVSDAAKLASFNKAISTRYPKKTLVVVTEEDFDELKEFEAVEIAYTAKIIIKNVAEIMRDKLRRRNMAAHPSSVDITQAQADDVVTDLVNNVVLKIT